MYYTFDLSRAYVVSKALKERRIGPLDHESLAREGVKVVDLSSIHVVPGRIEQRVGRFVSTARRQQRHRHHTQRCDHSAHLMIESPDAVRRIAVREHRRPAASWTSANRRNALANVGCKQSCLLAELRIVRMS